MPQLLPPDLSFPEDGGAERALWQALRDGLPDDAALVTHIPLLVGDTEHEIDLLVAWPGVGVAVIECKGGHISREHGTWYQGSGANRHTIDPVVQGRGARHALLDLLHRRGSPAADVRNVGLVGFPHTYVPARWEAPGLPRVLLLDRGDLDKGGIAVVGKIKHAVETHGGSRDGLDDAGLASLVDILAGSLPSQTDQLALAAEHETRVEHLTQDQARLLDTIRRWPRARVAGGAGSGKTWLALEQARRRARAGDRVALLCYSRGLGRYLQRVTQTWPNRDRPEYVGLFHDLAIAWGAEPGPEDEDYWERRLPQRLGELAAARSREERFDTIVIDEAQDFGELWWPSVLGCLRDPEDGGLFVFLDDAQRVFPRHGRDPIEMPALELDENLRSTKQIAQLFGSFAEGDLRPRGMSGPPVRVVDVPAEGAVDAADDAVEALLGEGWAPGQVALLTTQRRHPVQVNDVEAGGHAAYWDAFFAGDGVFYGTVLNFKGLERPVVVLAVNGLHDPEWNRRRLYTGMSRARSLLVVVGPKAQIEEAGGAGVRERLKKVAFWNPSTQDAGAST